MILDGDMRGVLALLADSGEQFDACVTDPPYHLTSTVKRFGGENAAPTKHGTDGAYARASAGFMGKQWDGGDIAFRPETWRAVYDVLKPGAHLVAFGGTRTFHRMAVAIEDAGFEMRDTLMWLYGTGFPKSHDVSKGIDKSLGATGAFGEPKSAAHAGWIGRGRMRGDQNEEGWQRPWMADPEAVDNAARKYLPGTPEAAAWTGWGTALKPAWEPIMLARKPLIGTVAANVLAHGTGALNIDGCRVDSGGTHGSADSAGLGAGRAAANREGSAFGKGLGGVVAPPHALGRWPANVLHDGSDEVEAVFAAFGERTSGKPGVMRKGVNDGACLGAESRLPGTVMTGFGDSGSVSRFFYSSKASARDRAGSKHPTVKPVSLMRWVVRMVTPPGGLVLDPFAGSGTTGAAAVAEGMRYCLIEREAEYLADIRRRLGVAESLPDIASLL